jgi:hypothetical protein
MKVWRGARIDNRLRRSSTMVEILAPIPRALTSSSETARRDVPIATTRLADDDR